jgi:hypothetical protein
MKKTPNTLPFAHRRLTAALAVAALAVGISAAMTVAVGFKAPAAEGVSNGRVEIESVTFGRAGFEPAQITRPPGRFVLAVDSLVRGREVTFRLDAEAGGRVRDFRLPPRKRRWSGPIELPPGRYLLTEASQPGSTCLIIISPGRN